MDEWTASLHILSLSPIWVYILKGTAFTLIISITAIVVSLAFSSVLALLRNYATAPQYRPFYLAAVWYIEIFRNTPLLLWIFVAIVFCPVPDAFGRPLFGLTSVETKMLFKTAVALTLFETACIAEIIRGGLNAVPKGQFETAYTQGFGVVGTMWFIILPQAFRHVVPTLLSQIITTVKDSSFLANVATIELMSRVRKIMSTAGMYNGTGTINVSDVFVLYGAAAAIYFVIDFSLSLLVRHIQKKRGTI
jgi:putative glutamine transport system permease protein